MDRKEMINTFYTGYNEDRRLFKSRHGQMEYLTTMHYIHKVLPEAGAVLEIGAGTGRYSVTLAKEGHRVTAVELAERNLELLRQNAEGLDNLTALQGDAVDLSCLPGDSFDLTLVFGPLYHLYEREDQLQALREAVRVTKPGGHILTAFLSVHAILFDNYLRGNLREGLAENFDADWQVRHFQDQLFTGFEVPAFEALFRELPVTQLTVAAVDGVLELAEVRSDFAMSDEEFEAYAAYHLRFCERRELLGASSHLLHLCRKNQL
jgi:SAM-dependent methyltransferase